MEVLFYIYLLLNILIVFFLIFPFITVLISLFLKEKKISIAPSEVDFACVITAYQNVKITIPLIDSFLKQNYSRYHIYLVADDCDATEIRPLFEGKPVEILQPLQKLGSKVRSFIYAIEHFKREHSAILILDPDNLGHPNFLRELNNSFFAGYQAVQGKRIAKNLDSVYACIDATGELYFNYTQKYVPYKLKSSSNIAGSGMAVQSNLFKSYLASDRIAGNLNKVIVAEDKILQNYLVSRGITIAFAKNALLYDEKVAKAEQVVRQRSRWLNSYFENVKYALSLILKGIRHFSVNQFLFGLLTVFPPMFLIIASSMFLFVTDLLLFPPLSIGVLSAIFIFLCNFILVLYLGKAPQEIWRNLYGIPAFVFFQTLALFKMKKANQDFLATKHTNYITIEKVIKDKDNEK
jgi:cellulose synthase/poly-beta-1,6-N-acetylglucosamine synthase-like glycosyltransferase